MLRKVPEVNDPEVGYDEWMNFQEGNKGDTAFPKCLSLIF